MIAARSSGTIAAVRRAAGELPDGKAADAATTVIRMPPVDAPALRERTRDHRCGLPAWLDPRPIRPIMVAVLMLVVAACGSPREAPLPPGTVVLIVGDSITAGYGIDPERAWPARLAAATGWRVVAAGVSGDRTSGGRERLPALLALHAPTLVIIELGGNDLLRRVPDAEIVANLEAMLDAAAAAGARTALMAAPQPMMAGAVTGYSAASLYRPLAQRRKVPLIADALPAVLSDDSLKLDALHPTAEGHAVLARRATDELAKIGWLAKP
jgi:acyl-CoA hydrolase